MNLLVKSVMRPPYCGYLVARSFHERFGSAVNDLTKQIPRVFARLNRAEHSVGIRPVICHGVKLHEAPVCTFGGLAYRSSDRNGQFFECREWIRVYVAYVCSRFLPPFSE